MANTLTGLLPVLFQAVNVVSREMVGMIPAVTLDAGAARAAVGDTVTSPVAPVSAATDIVAGVTPPDDGDQIIGNTGIAITKARRVPVRWNGEQTLSMNNGPGQPNILRDQFAQAMRTLVNEVEMDLAALYVYFSRAYGIAGTIPFATNLGDPAQLLKILKDNGAPASDLQLVINTAAGAALRTLANLTDADRAGTTALREQGILLPVHNFMIRESAQIKNHTKGTGAGFLLNNGAGYSVDSTDLAVDTGSGTVLAGDVVTLAGDTNKYLVGTALSAGALSLNQPGLREAHLDNDAMTVGNSFAANMAFHRGAIQLATRAPALPEGGDSADDRTFITDPVSGLTFEISVYRQYKQVQYEVALAWGVAVNKPEHCALLLG